MTEPLTHELEELFISCFGPPRFPMHDDHRPAARALVVALKRVSDTLPVRLETEHVREAKAVRYPRIHAVLLVEREPLLWSLCAPSNVRDKKPAHCKLEILARRTHELPLRVFREVERIAKSVGARLGDGKQSPILQIGIKPAITEPHAKKIADAVAEIARVVLPVYQ